jgi:hypothetical protein
MDLFGQHEPAGGSFIQAAGGTAGLGGLTAREQQEQQGQDGDLPSQRSIASSHFDSAASLF